MNTTTKQWAELNDFLARYSGELRLALDALVACRAAAYAAWVANDRPTDGTKNKLQLTLDVAVQEAERDVWRLTGDDGASITHDVRLLFMWAKASEESAS